MKTSIKTTLVGALIAAGCIANAANAVSYSIGLAPITKTMSDGVSVTYWGFKQGTGAASVPGPQIEVGVGDTLTISFTAMAPGAMEMNNKYTGHTIHMHGADVPQAEDGVPETNASTGGDTYTFKPTANMAGSLMYHCHVHTVKHLEMGLYGALIVRPTDASGNKLNQLTGDAATKYDYVQTFLSSSVDPTYHTATGDSTVFATYNPKYFLINGNEGKTTAAPATTFAAAVNKKVAMRLIGLHSVNSTFAIKDASGVAQPFTVYVQDGRQLPTAKSVTSLDVSPGQRFDIVFTTPATSGAWYPQYTYKKLRDNTAYATAYGKVTF